MNRRHFLGVLAVVPACAVCPAVARAPSRVMIERDYYTVLSGQGICGDSILVGAEEVLTFYTQTIIIDQRRTKHT